VLSERLRSTFVVSLNRFRLFEWFPRNPGLYHHRDAEYARRQAFHMLIMTYRAVIISREITQIRSAAEKWKRAI
jgi:hypothetical protein